MLTSLLIGALVPVAFLCLLLLCLEIGRRMYRRGQHDEAAQAETGLGAIEASVYGLMGLLLAFTFTGAAERFEVHRSLIVAETNTMEVAWLRLGMLPTATQVPLRKQMQAYVDSRIDLYRAIGNGNRDADRFREEGRALRLDLWNQSVTATQQQSSAAVTSLVMNALNEMFDVTRIRSVALATHPPLPIYLVLALLVMTSSLLAGYGLGKSHERNWVHMFVYAGTLAIAMYVILDLEYPRVGLIRVDKVDQVMVDLRKEMN